MTDKMKDEDCLRLRATCVEQVLRLRQCETIQEVIKEASELEQYIKRGSGNDNERGSHPFNP